MCKGCIFIYSVSTFRTNQKPLINACTSAEWLAHENAVFDIAWVPKEAQLVSMTHHLIP